MSVLRTVAIVVIVTVLAVDLVAANVVVASHRTALDPDFVKDTLADEGAYATLQGSVLSGGEGIPIEGNATDQVPELATALAERAITPGYLRSQVESNVDRVYGYLHGDRDELVVVIDLEPVKENVDDAVVAVVRNRTVAELLTQLVGNDTEALSLPEADVNTSLVLSMEEGPEEYAAAREAFRARIRAEVVTAVAAETYAAMSNDERLALVIDDYDPRDYTEAKKEELVADREADIRFAVRERVEADFGPQIDRRIDERMPEIRAELRSTVNASVATGYEGVDEPTAEVLYVFVDGLTTDMTYEEFDAELTAAKTRLATAVGTAVKEEVDREAPDTLVPTDDLDAETLGMARTARSAVRLVDVLGVALPVLALGLVGLLWWVSRSPAIVALGAGLGLLVAGGPAYAATVVARDGMRGALVGAVGDLGVVTDLVLALTDRVFAVFGTQSLALAVVGVVLVALGLALRAGLVSLPASESVDPED